MKKQVVRKVWKTFCDECGEEITDHSWSGSSDKDFHDMKCGGSKGKVGKTCYELYHEKKTKTHAKED
jgi:hypothetical protein